MLVFTPKSDYYRTTRDKLQAICVTWSLGNINHSKEPLGYYFSCPYKLRHEFSFHTAIICTVRFSLCYIQVQASETDSSDRAVISHPLPCCPESVKFLPLALNTCSWHPSEGQEGADIRKRSCFGSGCPIVSTRRWVGIWEAAVRPGFYTTPKSQGPRFRLYFFDLICLNPVLKTPSCKSLMLSKHFCLAQ